MATMAVSQRDDRKSESSAGDKLSFKKIVDAGQCVAHLRKPDSNFSSCSDKGATTGILKMKKNTSEIAKKLLLGRFQTKGNASDDLSDIDDAEVVGYLNTKEEMQYKRILWEAMNGKYANVKKRKISTETKKDASSKKASKASKQFESQKRSSKVNYEALRILTDELERGSEQPEINELDSSAQRSTVPPSQETSSDMHGSDESNCGDYHLEKGYGIDEETYGPGSYDEGLFDEQWEGDFNDEYF